MPEIYPSDYFGLKTSKTTFNKASRAALSLQTRQKGLQNNSGPKLSKLACVYLFLFAASECSHNLSKVIFPSYSSQLSTAADRCKNSSQGRITMELILLYFDLYNQKHCFLPYENITDNKKLRLPQGHFQIPVCFKK